MPITATQALQGARTVAQKSAAVGPTGYGAICTTGDNRIVVLRAPSQMNELEAPTTILESFGDGEIADAIYRGELAKAALRKARGQ